MESQIFSFCNSFAFLAWLYLLIFCHKESTHKILVYVVVLSLSVVYTYLLLKDFSAFDPNSFSTLESVMKLFTSPGAVLMGWVHYLAFDLLVGLYIVKTAKKHGLPRWMYSICLPFTFMFGPVGFLLFNIFKIIKTKAL